MFNVVIVDDEVRIAHKIEKYCQELRAVNLVDRIAVETNAEKFYDDLDTSLYENYNLYLLDIEMPIRGDELAQRVKSKYPDSQIVFISGYEKKGKIIRDNFSLLADVIDKTSEDSLSKPIRKQDLVDCLRSLISKSPILKLYDLYREDSNVIVRPISTADIIALTTDVSIIKKELPKNNIALLYMSGGYRHRDSLPVFIEKHNISDQEFIRISGYTYLNINAISEYCKVEMKITTCNNLNFKITRDFKSAFKDIENHFSRK